MTLFTEKENPGLVELYKYARSVPGPYQDRLRSTNAQEFNLDRSPPRPEFKSQPEFPQYRK